MAEIKIYPGESFGLKFILSESEPFQIISNQSEKLFESRSMQIYSDWKFGTNQSELEITRIHSDWKLSSDSFGLECHVQPEWIQRSV